MNKPFIEQQKELTRKALRKHKAGVPDFTEQQLEKIDTLITQIITNTGEELMRLAEGERKTQIRVHDYSSIHDQRTYVEIESRNKTIDTLKKHITNVTGVE